MHIKDEIIRFKQHAYQRGAHCKAWGEFPDHRYAKLFTVLYSTVVILTALSEPVYGDHGQDVLGNDPKREYHVHQGCDGRISSQVRDGCLLHAFVLVLG